MSLIIENVTGIVKLSNLEIEFFNSLLQPTNFKKKEFALKAGTVCRQQTFVNRGCLRIFYNDLQGSEHVAKFAIENSWAFDLESFTIGVPASYSIQALEETATLQLSKENWDLLCAEVPAFEKFFRVMFQNSYILLQHRITQHLYQKGDEKYIQFQKKYPGLEQRIPQKEIASYLGITPEFLSMIRAKKGSGIIS
ncbi:MAG TPA: Crp/Fnr family transcriptional regulator [Cyclobacteriaceae bacterium]|jgi:CRP-like cAMP-binding protein|nr:Crp/Fnr family transcriptional regulator [Cyclobacteriaceae bacterium]